jgi:hypothetical protein
MCVKLAVNESTKSDCHLLIRYCLIFSMLVWVSLLTACSYLTNFVVVNSSDQIVEVRYKVKKPGQSVSGILMLPIKPAIKPASQIEEQNPWRDLSTSEFTFDPDNRIVTISLKPGDALRIEQRNLVDGPQDERNQASNFAIEEIILEGANGVIRLEGEHARKSFLPQSKKTYTLTYD